MSDSRKLFNDFITKVEGFKNEPYEDSYGTPTIGPGMSLKDDDIRGLMSVHGYDPDEVIQQKRSISSDVLNDIHNRYVDKREPLIQGKVGKDLYDQLKPNQRAALMSMGYQSLNNIGPNLTGYIASDDPVGAIREIVLNTNKKDSPGILKRRFEEAELYGGPLDFSAAFKTMTPEEKKQLMDGLSKIENENTRQEVLAKYRPYLQDTKPVQFNKLQKMIDIGKK